MQEQHFGQKMWGPKLLESELSRVIGKVYSRVLGKVYSLVIRK